MSKKENAAMSVLLTNLRLLDLDRHEDWPGDPTPSFTGKESPQKQKVRSQYAEWVLYRLYEIWDPRDCVQVRLAMKEIMDKSDSQVRDWVPFSLRLSLYSLETFALHFSHVSVT